ncbi:MAG: beta-ketoacyl synthase, partial [Ilumatobacter sp.]
LFGHAHAASGLLHVAAAAVMLHHRVAIGAVPLLASNPGAGLPSGAGPRTVRIATTAFAGRVPRSILLAEASDHIAPSRVDAPGIHVYSGDDPAEVLEALAAGVESDIGPARLVIVAVDDEQLADRSQRARRHIEGGHPPGVGVRFRPAPLRGEMAFVFTAGGAAYHGMGSQLLRALPEIAAPISAAFPADAVSSWIFRPDDVPTPADYLWGTSLLSQVHARLTLGVLGLRPDAAIGYSSGESNMLFAFGVWNDNDAMRREIVECGMLDREIAGEFTAVARAWGEERVDWAVWNVLAPVDEVRDAIADEPRIHLMLINTDRDVVVGGDASSCRRLVVALGAQRCRPVGYNLACHVPEVRAEFHQPWVDVHTRAVTPVDGVRFYSNGVGGAYEVSTEACAATITRQAETTVDFPATIRAAYDDGVRIFVEHGPSAACTNFISQILAGRDILALHLDRRDRGIEQVFDVCAELVAAGIEVDHRALTERLTRDTSVSTSREGPMMSFPAHQPPPRLSAWAESTAQLMRPAPPLPPVVAVAESRLTGVPTHAIANDTASPTAGLDLPPLTATGQVSAATTLLHQLTAMTEIHEAFVAQQAELHRRFLTTRSDSIGLLEVDHVSTGSRAVGDHHASAPPLESSRSETEPPAVAVPLATAAPHEPAVPAAVALSAAVPDTGPRGPVWGKEQLEIHSSGRISELFGPMFAPQDQHTLQCRMPEPPLLLADRVTGLDAEPGVLGTGTIWTETDVVRDAWYLNGGFMPAGFMIESGQADLMLISWMGIDLLNQGTRSYRLLGCSLTYHGDLPSVGETLEYEIRVTGHAKHGDIRLFFFEYDCVIAGRPRLTVRDAQAGFFTRAELDDAQGVLWTPEAARSALRDDARVDPPVIVGTKASFTADEVRAFSEGRVLECFGPGFEWAQTHTRTPTIQAGAQLFIDEVTTFDPTGGPWGRGFMRCETAIVDDAWFFHGHFKNDPCMPGNFMVEACIEAMSFYLAALGHTTRVDGWRFRPLPEQPFDLKCRGEINPQTDRVAYELYVEEVWAGPHPTVVCDVLGFVLGEPAFHAHRIGVELVPDWPLTTMPEIHEHVVEPVEVATDDEGFPFDWKAMISCAWGRPSEAFGSMYEVFDGTRRSPRLPGPPYHFMSRVVDVVGELGVCAGGMEIVCEYDIPDDAWYFDQNGTETMPFAVLLEAALQPCGWVASAVGSVTGVEEDMLFRNLDGTGTVVGELTRTAGTLTTRVKLTSVSRAGGMIVEGFDVECRLGDRLVYTMKTVFGFFPPEAFENQVGLPLTDDDRALHALAVESSETATDLTTRPARYCSGTARLAGDMLLMVDRARHVEGGGSAGLGVVVGEK